MSRDTSSPPPLPDAFAQRLLAGDRITMGRAISAVENETPRAQAVLRTIFPHLGRARVVGFTGSPGVGKSTLVSAYIGELRGRGQSVGVVAVDPSSPLTGGAILGDRVRMGAHAADAGVFVRSVASRGHLGGLSRTTERVIDVMDAAGKDVVIVETVGTGQAEVEIAEIADTKVVVLAPGLGDEVQAAKAGILEIADIVVVNKADLPDADRTVNHVREMLRLSRREDWEAPVLKTRANSGAGVDELAAAIDRHAAQVHPQVGRPHPRRRMRRVIASLAAQQVRRTVEADESAHMDALCDAVLRGDLDFQAAANLAVRNEGTRIPVPDEAMARLAGRDTFAAETLGARIVQEGAGTAQVELTVGPPHLNFHGTCHGGVLFSLADAAFALASNSGDVAAVAIDAHITYAAAVHPGDVLVATAHELRRSRRIATYRVEVARNDGTPVASFVGTVYITGTAPSREPQPQQEG